MPHSHVWHASFTCVTNLIHTCDMPRSHVWQDSFTRVTCLIHMCGKTHSHVWHALFTCVTITRLACLVHICDETHLHVCHASFTCVTRLIHICDKTKNSFTCVTCVVYWRMLFLQMQKKQKKQKKHASVIHVTTFTFVLFCRSLFRIDWFWLRGWINNKGVICTGTAPLFWNFISLFERPRTRSVGKIGSQNQSIVL